MRDITQILESTKKGIQSGSVSVKDSTKSLSQIDETLSLLSRFIEKISIFHQSKKDIESKLSVYDNEQLLQKESTLSKYENNKSVLESKIITTDNQLKETTEFIPKCVESIESSLNEISAIQYSIRLE